MVKVEASCAIACDVDTAYDFVVVRFFDNYPRWSPEVVELEPLDGRRIRLGTRGRQVRVDQGRRSETTFAVTRLEPVRAMQVDAESGARFAIRYEFEPAGERLTRLRFSFALKRLEFYMRPFEKLIRIAIQDGSERTVRNIKGLIERGQ